MWRVAVSIPLLPAVLVASTVYGAKVAALCRRLLSWLRRLTRGKVCVRSTHAYVFTNCTHGKVVSVLETFDLYNRTHPHLCVSPQAAAALDEAVRRTRPSLVLELGTHCGYSSVRMLRLLPPGGKLITVEQDPVTADLGEEIMLVSNFKHDQFQVLTSSSAEAIPKLRSSIGVNGKRSRVEGSGEGFSLVLMDHDAQQYLPDLLALEREELLNVSGCSILLISRKRGAEDIAGVLGHVRTRPESYCVMSDLQCVVEIFYQKKTRGVSR